MALVFLVGRQDRERSASTRSNEHTKPRRKTHPRACRHKWKYPASLRTHGDRDSRVVHPLRRRSRSWPSDQNRQGLDGCTPNRYPNGRSFRPTEYLEQRSRLIPDARRIRCEQLGRGIHLIHVPLIDQEKPYKTRLPTGGFSRSPRPG